LNLISDRNEFSSSVSYFNILILLLVNNNNNNIPVQLMTGNDTLMLKITNTTIT